MRDRIRLVQLSLRTLAGKRWWLTYVFVTVWPLLQAGFLAIRWRQTAFEPENVQNFLLGMPLWMLGIFLGARIIGLEIDDRTLEIAYTVPGGAHRIWAAKFVAGVLLLVGAVVPLAIVTHFVLTPVPWQSIYGALQAGVFFLALAMGTGALFRSFISGAVGAAVVLILSLVLTGFANVQVRLSPYFNPLHPNLRGADPVDIWAWSIQNRVGFVLVTATIVLLSWVRAERRERLLD